MGTKPTSHMDSLTGEATSMRRLETDLLLRAYGAGLFPMADMREAEDIFWVEPRRRGILPLDNFHLPRSLAKVLKQERFLHSRDLAFDAVIRNCAARAEGREQSWINGIILDAYMRLHAEGHAHSLETWDREGRLVGGLYGVRIGAAFFGESMFSRTAEASKAALAHLVARLRLGGFQLLDTQFLTSHLSHFGVVEVKRADYVELLKSATIQEADWLALERHIWSDTIQSVAAPLVSVDCSRPLGDPAEALLSLPVPERFGPSGRTIVQLLSQTS